MMPKLFGLDIDELSDKQWLHVGEILAKLLMYAREHSMDEIDLDRMEKELDEETFNLLTHLLHTVFKADADELLPTEKAAIREWLEGLGALGAYLQTKTPTWVRFLFYVAGYHNYTRYTAAIQHALHQGERVNTESLDKAEFVDPYHPKNRPATLQTLSLPIGSEIQHFGEWEVARIVHRSGDDKDRDVDSKVSYRWHRQGTDKTEEVKNKDLRQALYRLRVQEGDYVIARIRGGQVLQSGRLVHAPKFLFEVYKHPDIPRSSKRGYEDLSEVKQRLEQMIQEDVEPKLCRGILPDGSQCTKELGPRNTTGLCKTCGTRERVRQKRLRDKGVTG